MQIRIREGEFQRALEKILKCPRIRKDRKMEKYNKTTSKNQINLKNNNKNNRTMNQKEKESGDKNYRYSENKTIVNDSLINID